MKWYKRDPDAALVGMSTLTMAERGAYNSILDALYSRNGNLPDDDHFVARIISCDVRTWRDLKHKLMVKGKIWTTQDRSARHLQAIRVERELERARSFSELQSKKAKIRWKSKDGASQDGSTVQAMPYQKPDIVRLTVGEAQQLPQREDPAKSNGGEATSPLSVSAPPPPPPGIVPRPQEPIPVSASLLRIEYSKRLGRAISDAEFEKYLDTRQQSA